MNEHVSHHHLIHSMLFNRDRCYQDATSRVFLPRLHVADDLARDGFDHLISALLHVVCFNSQSTNLME